MGKKYPATVVTPPVTGVKEQTGWRLCESSCQNGALRHWFLTLAGGGRVKGSLATSYQNGCVRDVRNAVDFLRTLDVTDTNNVFNTGICMGSGWAMYETAFDTRINAVAMISPYLIELDTPLNVLGCGGLPQCGRQGTD